METIPNLTFKCNLPDDLLDNMPRLIAFPHKGMWFDQPETVIFEDSRILINLEGAKDTIKEKMRFLDHYGVLPEAIINRFVEETFVVERVGKCPTERINVEEFHTSTLKATFFKLTHLKHIYSESSVQLNFAKMMHGSFSCFRNCKPLSIKGSFSQDYQTWLYEKRYSELPKIVEQISAVNRAKFQRPYN